MNQSSRRRTQKLYPTGYSFGYGFCTRLRLQFFLRNEIRTFCDETMIGLPVAAERQIPDASNAGLERGYLNMSVVSLTAKGVRRTFRVDRQPKDLLFFTEGEKDGRKKKAWLVHAQSEFLLYQVNGQYVLLIPSGMRGNALLPMASLAILTRNHIDEALSERTARLCCLTALQPDRRQWP
jgi:hypothetical protein